MIKMLALMMHLKLTMIFCLLYGNGMMGKMARNIISKEANIVLQIWIKP